MKKKCMAVGGTAKKPASMEEQLAGIRGKVRPGYQAGGTIYRNGSTFSDQQIGEPMKGIASAGMSGQVDNMLDRTKAMPGSIASAPQPYAGSVIPVQSSQQAMRAATNFGMPPAGTAPAATSQTISTGDYSAGPRQAGFVDEYGKPRTTPAQDAQSEAAARQAEIAARSKEQIDNIANMKGLSDRQRVAAVSGIAANASRSGVGTDIAGAIGTPMNQLSNKQQLRVSQAQYGVNMEEDGLTPPTGRGYRRGYAGGGIVDSIIRTVGKILPESSGEKYEPGIQSRAAEDPARHWRAEALNPRTQTAPSEAPPASGFQEEADRRRKQMEDAKNYEDGGMVESEDEDESEDKNKRSIEISIDIPVGDKKGKAKNSEAADYACGGKVKKLGMASGGMVRFAGKGGPRDDKIPVKVAGQEINVSNGENAVILPAKTAANPAALYAIGGIIQATNDGRRPKMGIEKGGKYKDGVYPYDDKNPPTAQEVYAPTYAAPGSIISALPEGGYLRTPEGRAQVMDALSGKGLRPDVGIIGPRNASPAASVQAASPAQTYSNEGRPSALGQTYESYKPPAQGITAGVANAGAHMQNVAANDGMTTTQMGAGFDPTKLQMANGYGMATNAAGKTIAVGPAEYVGADGKPTSRWADTQQYKDAIARNEADKLRLAEMRAQRLGADPMAVQKASQGIAQAVQQSGLAAQQAGQAQQVQQFAIDRAAREQSLIDAWDKAGTPEQKQAIAGQLKIMRGQQDKEGQFKDAVEEVVDEKTGQVIKRPVIYNANTGQPVQQGQAQAQQSFKTADEVEAARKAGKVKSGDVVIINGRPARIN